MCLGLFLVEKNNRKIFLGDRNAPGQNALKIQDGRHYNAT